MPRTGEALLEFKRFYEDNLPKVSDGENLGIQGPVYMTSWDRTLVCLIMFPIGRDKALNAKMRRAFERLGEAAAERGWAEYRAPAAFQDAGRERLLVQQPFADAGCARRSRMPWIRTASSRPGATACGRST